MSKVVVRGAYAYDVDAVSNENALWCDPDEGMTHQSFAKECDINEIVRRFGLTGELPDSVSVPQYGDFTGISDYKTAMDAVARAQSGFMELPGELRARFENDPQRLMEFMDDPANREMAVELGLVNKPKEVTRDVVMAIDELRASMVPSGSGDVAK